MQWTQADSIRAMHRKGLRGTHCIEPKFGHRDKDGYVRIRVGPSKRYVHRYVFELEHGLLQPEEQVLHTCDNPPCCNLNHLFRGTNQDNVDDRQAKGRQPPQPRGEQHTNAILTWIQVREIRSKYATGKYTQKQLCQEYGISRNAMSSLLTYKTWKE